MMLSIRMRKDHHSSQTRVRRRQKCVVTFDLNDLNKNQRSNVKQLYCYHGYHG